MSSLAALLVLVACPADEAKCLPDPVRVVSYDNPAACEKNLPAEFSKAKRPGYLIYGGCNSVEAHYLAGRARIDVTGQYPPRPVREAGSFGRLAAGWGGAEHGAPALTEREWINYETQ